MENYNNIVIISADRNGSTAFQHDVLGRNLNNDKILWMGECFSQDPEKNQPPRWYDPVTYKPKDVINVVNHGTGKSVLLKIQITYPEFNTDFLDINATRKIFYHRNLFDSTLSRCIAQKTGHWFKFSNDDGYDDLTIPEDFFLSRLEYRIEQYNKHIDSVLEWANEVYRYESYKYSPKLTIKRNPDKSNTVKNYNKLYNLFAKYRDIIDIESKVQSCLTNT